MGMIVRVKNKSLHGTLYKSIENWPTPVLLPAL